MRDYTTDGLIENIKRRGAIPADQSTYLPAEMIKMADDEMQIRLVPILFQSKADFFLTFSDVTTTSSLSYDIPEAAFNRALHSIFFVDAAGNETELTYVDFNEETFAALDYPRGACFTRGEKLHLFPRAFPDRTLRLYYYRLPNRLVPTTEAAQVTAVDSGTGIVTTTGVPADWTAGTTVCCVKGRPGFQLRFAARDLTAASSPTVTLADVSDIEIGDWIALEGDSPIPQLPVEAQPVLAQATIAKILEGLGDPGLAAAKTDLRDALAAYVAITGPRIDRGPKSLVSRRRLLNYMF